MPRIAHPATVIAVLAVLLGGCSASGGDGGAGDDASRSAATSDVPARADADLVVWTDAEGAATLRKTVQAFAEDAGVDAAVQVLDAQTLDEAFIVANTAGTGPDVVVTGHQGLGRMLQNGAVEPLGLQQVDAARYGARAVDAVTDDGTVYGLPYAVSAVVLYRNTDLAPLAPPTVEQLLATGAAAGTSRPLCLPVGEQGSPEHLHPWYRSAGGYLFGRTTTGALDLSDVGVGEPGSLAAARRFAALADAGALDTQVAPATAVQIFADGRCPYVVAGPEALTAVRDAGVPWAVSPVPGFAAGAPAQPLTSVRALFVASKGARASLARRFVLDTVNRPSTMLALFKATEGTPAMTEVVRLLSAEHPEQQTFAAAAEAGEVRPALPAAALLWGPLGSAEAAIVDGAAPEETMRRAGVVIDDALGQPGTGALP